MLLVTKGNDGIELGGANGWIKPKHQTHSHADPQREHYAVPGDNSGHTGKSSDQPWKQQADPNADKPADSGKHNRLHQDVGETWQTSRRSVPCVSHGVIQEPVAYIYHQLHLKY